VRTALYMAALVASRANPVIAAQQSLRMTEVYAGIKKEPHPESLAQKWVG